MDNNFEDTQDWSPKFSVNEQECINHLESLPDNEHEFESEKSIYDRKLWNHFQSCALDIAQLYKYNSSVQHNLWNSFQQASTNVACLYKECSEFQRKMFEISSQNGYNKRNKELLTWAKKKKSYIRREDLLSFLSGRSYPAPHHNSFFHHHRLAKHGRASRGSEDIQRFLNTSSPSPRGTSRLMFNDAINDTSVASPFNDSLDSQEATKLEAFREALALSGLRTPSNLLSNNNRRSPRNSNLEDLSEFISSEYQRHVEKRPSSMDVSMDSPTHSNKRAKFC